MSMPTQDENTGKLVREALASELALKNSRLDRLFTSQTILGAAFGLSLQAFSTESLRSVIPLVVRTIATTGIALAVLDAIGITGAYLAVRALWLEYKQVLASDEPVHQRRMKMLIFKSPASMLIGILYSYLLPITFVSLWIIAAHFSRHLPAVQVNTSNRQALPIGKMTK